MPAFEDLVAQAEAAPVDGWSFAWLDGRASEERPAWGYARRLLPPRFDAADAALDVQTGGGEVLADVLRHVTRRPRLIAVTEGWPPNVARAGARLGTAGVAVVQAAEDGALPFRDEAFDLVVSRHPVVTRWEEVARVLRPGGTYLAQHVGAGSNRELTDAIMGPRPVGQARSTGRASASARAAGLDVVDLRSQALRVEFRDVGAVVWFLRKVVWTVPGFTVDRYRRSLRRLHERIQAEGPFVATSQRFLIEARRPAR